MTGIQLRLRQSTTAAHGPRAADAWLISGGDSASWLREIEGWKIAGSSLQLAVLPKSAADLTAAALFVVAATVEPARVHRARPYRRVAEKLFVPLDAELFPPVDDRELSRLLRLPLQVFHPSIGLVGFREEELLRLEDLLSGPEVTSDAWDAAEPLGDLRPRVRFVGPIEEPTVDDVFKAGSDDIASSSTTELVVEPHDSAATGFVRKALGYATVAAASTALSPLALLNWLIRARPTGVGGGGGSDDRRRRTNNESQGAGPGLIARLHGWAHRHVDRISKALLDDQARAIAQLQRLFHEDPDEALRHALPLTAIDATRGRQPSTGQLGTTEVRFSLRAALGRAGRKDVWDIDAGDRASLMEHYKRAAERELRLRRFQRAAYIFAELLGNFASAASALQAGRFFREAAVLYDRKLNDKLGAVRCLEAGGLLSEAAKLYCDLKRFEEAGDCASRIGRKDEADRHYRQAVAELLQRDRPLAAAVILEKKLVDPDQALCCLLAKWPRSSQAAKCVTASFELMARLGRHVEAQVQIDVLRTSAMSDAPPDQVVRLLGQVVKCYPERGVSERAAAAIYAVASQALPTASLMTRRTIAKDVGRLHPEDSLLSRDALKFADRQTEASIGVRPVPGEVDSGLFLRADQGFDLR